MKTNKSILLLFIFLIPLIAYSNVSELNSIKILESPHTVDFLFSFSSSDIQYYPAQTGNIIQLDLPQVRYRKGETNNSVYKGSVMMYQTKYIDDEQNSVRIVITLTDPVPYEINKTASSLKLQISKTKEEVDDFKVQEQYKNKMDKIRANTLYNKATDAMRFKEWEKAYNYLKDAIVMDKNNSEIEKALMLAQEKVFAKKVYDSRLREALEFFTEGNYSKTSEILERFNEQYGRSATSSYYLGKAYFEMKDYKNAKEEFEYIKENHGGYEFISSVQTLLERVDYYIANDLSGADVIDFSAENKTVHETISSLLYGTGFKYQIEDGIARYITVDIRKKTLKEALDIIAEDAGLSYEIDNKLIKISKKRLSENVLSKLGLENLSLEEVLDVISYALNLNLIVSPEVDKTKRIKFYITNNEISLEEFFDLMLKTNDLVALKYNESTYYIADALKAKESSYQQKFPKIFNLQYVTPEEVLYAMKSIKKFREVLDFDNISVFNFDKEKVIIKNETQYEEKTDKLERYSQALDRLEGNEATEVGASSKDELWQAYVSQVVAEASKTDVDQKIETSVESGLSGETLDMLEGRVTDDYTVQVKDMISTRRKVKALYAYETRENLQLIENFIKSLDVKRKQVIIAMKVMDIDHDYTNTFGIDTKFDGSSDQLNVSKLKNISKIKLESTLNFLEQKNKGRTIASPTIRAIDGHAAKIKVTNQYKLKTKDSETVKETVTDDNGFPHENIRVEIFDVIEDVEIGINMVVLPSINDNGEITIDISVKENAISGQTPEGIAIITNRDTDTVVRLQDGETIVMGGLISRRMTNENKNVPLISQLPGIGRFFRKRSKVEEENEMVIFMSAYIVKDEDENKVTYEKEKKPAKDFDKVISELKHRLGK